MPRILFLGALKITTVFIFGFFAVVVIPSYVQADAPMWQSAGLAVASVVPILAIWYLTSPMVMWIHLLIPKYYQQHPRQLEKFYNHIPPTTEVVITTMGVLGKPRVSAIQIKDLRYEKRRFGLVNYVRDVSREKAGRKWYQFPPMGEFKIEDATPGWEKSKNPWQWYAIMRAFRKRQAPPAQ